LKLASGVSDLLSESDVMLGRCYPLINVSTLIVLLLADSCLRNIVLNS
jgi:hypothetical protein